MLGYATFGYFVSRSEQVTAGHATASARSTATARRRTTNHMYDGVSGSSGTSTTTSQIVFANVNARNDDRARRASPTIARSPAQYSIAKYIAGP